ncbi:hypothetical protein BOTBODRAFT_33538 [Botryobasidium botryosum FD-172 SS1]|uniref:Glucose-methanol-choline oxidoreductase N-terminal domain-containing protein n=1 Tax=Botryobasidium botryosum (strain FD-172 SS1) TaxID=930990 RepID=A0A067MD93_BOTB1|nr:hypothetical protein BOTBODRAFT_33538 [Botryobasidium botryosum FD-172 SS1]
MSRNTLAVAATVVAGLGLLHLLKPATSPRYLEPKDIRQFSDDSQPSLNDNAEFAEEFDIVIIGGGTAGCVLASRLSEQHGLRVLVLEAGQSARDLRDSQMPVGFPRLMRGPYDWNLFTEPQENCLGKRNYWPRGKLLGGCSSTNAMIFQMGAPSDYDEWASSNEPGASEWAYAKFNKYMLKFEKHNPHKSFPLDMSLRGALGPIMTGFGYLSGASKEWLSASENAGIPSTNDWNTSRGTIGSMKPSMYLDSKGRRASAETGYLTPDVLARPNLKVVVHAQVSKILFESGKDGTKRAVGVEFRDARGGPSIRVRAKKEVVLSAGAIHTPHLLMLSGVGPAEHLATHNISPVHDLPGVGSNLRDHGCFYINFFVKNTETLAYLNDLRPSRGIGLRKIASLLRWIILGTGPLTSNIAETAAFVRSTDPYFFPASGALGAIEDTTSGPSAPDLELMGLPFFIPVGRPGEMELPSLDTYAVGTVLLRPTSVGTIRLRSSNPSDAPLIDPKYLSTQHDIDVLVRGLKLALRIIRTEPFASLIDDSVPLDQELYGFSDKQLAEVVRERITTLYHPACTARMAPLAKGGVVDPYLRVHGIPNLRIVDASIMPNIVSGHTAGPVIAIAEKAADIIKGL